MDRPRAADDFAVIRERLEELRRERDEAATADAPTPGAVGEDEAERRRRERVEGLPPPWVPTIFLPQPTD